MNKISLIVLTIFFVSTLSGCKAKTGSFSQSSKSYKFESEMTVKSSGRTTQQMKSIYYLKAGKYRMEMIPSNKPAQKMIFIYDGKNSYQYNPAQNTAIKMAMPQQETAQKFLGATKCDCQTIGGSSFKVTNQRQETFDGKPCTVCEFTGATGKNNSMKTWMVKGSCSVLKTEAVNGNNTTTMHYYNFAENPSLGDDLFVLPSGVKIMDMNEMMKQSAGSSAMQGILDKIGH